MIYYEAAICVSSYSCSASLVSNSEDLGQQFSSGMLRNPEGFTISWVPKNPGDHSLVTQAVTSFGENEALGTEYLSATLAISLYFSLISVCLWMFLHREREIITDLLQNMVFLQQTTGSAHKWVGHGTLPYFLMTRAYERKGMIPALFICLSYFLMKATRQHKSSCCLNNMASSVQPIFLNCRLNTDIVPLVPLTPILSP